jgi:hypothetical protein
MGWPDHPNWGWGWLRPPHGPCGLSSHSQGPDLKNNNNKIKNLFGPATPIRPGVASHPKSTV